MRPLKFRTPLIDNSLNLWYCSTTAQPVDDSKSNFMRKAVSFVLITVTGGVALSALDDLAIYRACSR